MHSSSSVPTTPLGLSSLPSPLGSENAAPLDLGKSSVTSVPISPITTPLDPGKAVKGAGLMRRISRGAHNKLRPRASTSNLKNRDQASGPTVVRQRSSSRTVVDGSHDISEAELDSLDEAGPLEPTLDGIDGQFAAPKSPPRRPSARYLGPDGQVTVPSILLHGTKVTKVTRKTQKVLVVRLDQSHSKLSWSVDGSHSVKHLYVDDIKEIRVGSMAKTHLEEFGIPADALNRWITVIYSDPDKTKGRATKDLHLLAPNVDIWREWRDFLQFLIRDRGRMMAAVAGSSVDESSLIQYWNRTLRKKFDANQQPAQGEWFDYSDFVTYCRSYSIYKSEKDLKFLFSRIDRKKTGNLNQAQFLELSRQIVERKDIKRLFESLKSTNSETLSSEEFLDFLKSSQGNDVVLEAQRSRALFERYATKKVALGILSVGENDRSADLRMTFHAFQDFLLNDVDNPPIASTAASPCFDRPLNEYYISSSHNTYLMGRQFAGHSNPEGYVDALKKGCRCVEIDCWDGDDGRPKVTHGRTLSSWTSFDDCVKTINKYAFYKSKYPLIISLEVHCNPSQQKIMADIMKARFGSKLLRKPLSANNFSLPSPNELRECILIKVREPMSDFAPAFHSAAATANHRRQRSKSEADAKTTQRVTALPPAGTTGIEPILLSPQPRSATFGNENQIARRSKTNAAGSVVGSSSDESGSEVGDREFAKKKKSVTSNIVVPLGELGVYTRGTKYVDFKAPSNRTPNHILSFSEGTFEEKCKILSLRPYLEKHNQKYLMRVYPRARRLNSTNFDPLQFWRHGVQMVATNWQTYDLGTQINDAMFAAGDDQHGYVLKPEELRLPRQGNTSERFPIPKKKLVQFSVEVISARQLDAPPNLRSDAEMNPYVEIEMYSADNKTKGIATAEGGTDASARGGMSGIGYPTRRRTKPFEGNGYDPFFDEQINLKLETEYPSLVFVRWTVWHSPDGRSPSTSKEPLASFVAKLSTLQQGYRRLRLRNQQGEELVSDLFCRIHKEDQQDVAPKPSKRDNSPESPRGSEDGTRSGRDILRRVFTRTPSERAKTRKETDTGHFSRTASTEK